ncbi:MAG: RrF2 family transcriptional regulator, partial [Promethearchaeota archaeon]
MKLSTRALYGTRALLELDLRQEEGLVQLKETAKKQQIPLPYLEQLVSSLITGGIFRSIKGPKGGIYLDRSPEYIKLSEVIQLLEGSLALVECVNDPSVCERSGFCVTRDIWGELKMVMGGVFETT